MNNFRKLGIDYNGHLRVHRCPRASKPWLHVGFFLTAASWRLLCIRGAFPGIPCLASSDGCFAPCIFLDFQWVHTMVTISN
jgi:hypothetical protein